MAAAAITKVIINLLGKHGMSQGVMKASKLGFNRGQISKAIQKFKKSKPQTESFAARKAHRAAMTPSPRYGGGATIRRGERPAPRRGGY